VNGYILRAMMGIMILQRWMMTLMKFIKKKSCHPLSFIVDPSAGLDDLLGDADDIEMPIVVKQKWKPIKKKVWLPRLRTRLPDHDADKF
jgi:hypothetical protein